MDDLSGVASMDEEKARSATKTEIKVAIIMVGMVGMVESRS